MLTPDDVTRLALSVFREVGLSADVEVRRDKWDPGVLHLELRNRVGAGPIGITVVCDAATSAFAVRESIKRQVQLD
jgi:hypothetical protein